jgi:26S proteasome regulatory subunit N7
MADEIVLPIPNLNLPQQFFTLLTSSLSHLHDSAAKSLLAGIEADRKLSLDF